MVETLPRDDRPTRLRVGPLALDLLDRTAERDGRALVLRPREYALLAHLCRRAGTTVDRPELLRAVWRLASHPGTNVVEAHVSRVRSQLDGRSEPPMLLTVRGEGYRLDVPGAPIL